MVDQIRWSGREGAFSSPAWNGTVHLKQTSMLFLWRVSGAQGQDRRRESLQFFFMLYLSDCRCAVSRPELSPPRLYQLTVNVSMHGAINVFLSTPTRFIANCEPLIYIYVLNRWIEVTSVTRQHFYTWFKTLMQLLKSYKMENLSCITSTYGFGKNGLVVTLLRETEANNWK